MHLVSRHVHHAFVSAQNRSSASLSHQLFRKGGTCKAHQPTNSPDNFPDFDSFNLNDEYYREMGLTTEEAAEQLEEAWNVDPDGYTLRDGVAEKLSDDNFEGEDETQTPPFGPPAILLAGFRDHEFGMVRMTLDDVGGHTIKVMPCMGPMLYQTVNESIASPEPDWEEPKPDSTLRSGDWGSQRTVLFSGLSDEDQLIILDLLEESGLPTLIVAVAATDNKDRIVGEVLAEAIQKQRRWRPQKTEGMAAALPDSVPDNLEQMSAGGLKINMPAPQYSAVSSKADPQKPGLGAVTGAPRTEEPSFQSSQRQGAASATSNPATVPKDAAEISAAASQQLQTSTGAAVAPAVPPEAVVSPQPPQKAAELTASRSGKGMGESQIVNPKGFGQSGLDRFAPRVSQKSRGARLGVGDKAVRQEKVAGSSTGASLSERSSGSENSAETVREQYQDTVKGAGKSFMANFEHNTFATQQRELRAAAAEEMKRRAAMSQAGATSSLEASNLIDAVASGEDLDTVLQTNREPDSEQQREETVRRRMEAVLEQMKATAKDLPPEEKEKLAKDLKVIESDKEAVEKVLQDMGASLDSVPKNDREVVKAQLREEAWQPTKDAIGAALACGISAAELRALVDQAEKDKSENRLGWYPSVANVERKQDLEKTGASQ